MKATLLSLAVIIISIIVTGCAGSLPDWYSATELPEYSRDLYIGAAGTGKDFDEALINAQASIAAQIRVSLKSSVTVSVKEIIGEDSSEWNESTEKITRSYVEEQLRAVEVVRKNERDGEYYVYAVLNKRNLVATIRDEMDLLISQIGELQNLARSSIRNGHIITAMENYLDASQDLKEYVSKNALYIALSNERHGSSQSVLSLNRLETEIRERLNGIIVEVASGDDQDAAPGIELSMPIIFIAGYNDVDNSDIIPLQRFPFVVTDMTSGKKQKVVTDANGKIIVHVVAGGGLGRHQLVCKPQMERLPESFRSQLTELKTVAYYNVEPIKDLIFSVEVYSGRGVRQPDVEKSIIQTVASNGYTVSMDAPLLLLGKLKEANIKEIKQLSGSLFVATTELSVELIAMPKRSILGSTMVKGQGTGKNAAAATNNAMRNIRLTNEEFGKMLTPESLK